jgi:CHAD domain-containing protein
LREHRPPESTQAELHFAIRFEEDQQPVFQQELRQVPVARYEQQLHPVSTPPARQLDKPSVRLRLGESLQAGVQRLSLEHLDHAIAVLESGDLSPDIAVHEARKAMRRVRGLLRLVRDALGPRVYRFENVHLRDTGRLLSEARNAAVAIDTLAAVESRYGNLVTTDIFIGAHGALERRRAGIVEHAIGDPERRGQVVRALRSARARYAALPLEGTLGGPTTRPSIRDSYGAIAPGLARTYNRGRLRMADAYRSPSDERFHEWRKRVRYLRFQMQTLTDLWSSVTTTRSLLGNENETFLLRFSNSHVATFGSERGPKDFGCMPNPPIGLLSASVRTGRPGEVSRALMGCDS